MSCHKNNTNKTFGHLQIATPFKDTERSHCSESCCGVENCGIGVRGVVKGVLQSPLDTCSQPSLSH